jgi:1,4-dihydroxy-2-naphthoyl-CoA hydrolase
MEDLAATLPFQNTIHEALGIHAVEAGPDKVVLQMEVGPQVHQPMGLLHGGASAVMAESAASIGSFLNCTPDQFTVGVDLNITHLKGVRSGTVTATAVPVRKGRTMQVWTVEIVDDNGTVVAVSRCTLAVRPIDPAS